LCAAGKPRNTPFSSDSSSSSSSVAAMLSQHAATGLQPHARCHSSPLHMRGLYSARSVHCQATKTRTADARKRQQQQQSPVLMPDPEAVEQANAADALFSVSSCDCL
jgi:hypothetical protein